MIVVKALLCTILVLMIVAAMFRDLSVLSEQGRWRLHIEFVVVVICLTALAIWGD